MREAAQFQRSFAQAIMAARAPARSPAALAVYRNTWLQGLIDALGSNYPTVAMILGDDLFEAVALEFARNHPAATPVLALYGAEFPDFLKQHDAGREVPYLRDVARLERLWTESFFAPDAPALDEEDFAALSPAELLELRVRLHPATRISRFETPAVTIWQAHRAPGEFEAIEPEWKAERALVSRGGSGISVALIDEAAFHLLASVKSGRSIGSALAAAAEILPGADLSKALATVMSTAALATQSWEED